MTDDVVDALAVFRLTRLAVADTFPPAQAARFAVLRRLDEKSWQAELLSCSWCLSFWVAVGVLAVRRRAWWRRALGPALAASAVAGILSERWS